VLYRSPSIISVLKLLRYHPTPRRGFQAFAFLSRKLKPFESFSPEFSDLCYLLTCR